MSNDFWASDPGSLNFLEFWPCSNQTIAQKYNSGTVLTIYLMLVVALGTKSFIPLYICVLIIGIIAIIYYLTYGEVCNTEGFMSTSMQRRKNKRLHNLHGQRPDNLISPPGRKPAMYGNDLNRDISSGYVNLPLRTPTKMNPFMNVPITDYDRPQDYKNYHRYKIQEHPSPHTEHIRSEVENDFKKGLFQDPNGRLFDRQNSQREYISQPVGGVPNTQGEFANWLYGMNEGVCKSGSIYMRYGVDVPDQLLCNGINAAEPTNNGILRQY